MDDEKETSPMAVTHKIHVWRGFHNWAVKHVAVDGEEDEGRQNCDWTVAEDGAPMSV
jgi:hypothetical protein